MQKPFKFRLIPTKEQEIMLSKSFASCRFVYNHYLGKKIDLYKGEAKSMSYVECDNHNQSYRTQMVNDNIKIEDNEIKPKCDIIHDRDANVSKNIVKQGLKELKILVV